MGNKQDVIIIGSGYEGLSCATYLAQKGCKVKVLAAILKRKLV